MARGQVQRSRVYQHKFNAQELANTAWAFATVDLSDELLFTVLAKAAELHGGVYEDAVCGVGQGG